MPQVRTVVHLHGAEVEPDSDGHPEAWLQEILQNVDLVLSIKFINIQIHNVLLPYGTMIMHWELLV